MGISDGLKGLRKKAEDAAAEHKEQIDEAVEKAEAAADQRTEGRYHDQIAKAGGKVEAYVDNRQPEETETQEAPSTAREASPAPPEDAGRGQ